MSHVTDMSTPIQVVSGKVVSFHYTLTDEGGEVLDSSGDGPPLDDLPGSGNIVPGLEKGLEGRSAGEAFRVRVAPAEGYGERDPHGVQQVPRRAFPADAELEPGTPFGAQDSHGARTTVWIEKVEGDVVTIDLNHPLAGRTLDFDIRIESVRDATREELAHGHVHGPHGHHHH